MKRSYRRGVTLSLLLLVLLAAVAVFFTRPDTGSPARTAGPERIIPREESPEKQSGRTSRKAARRETSASRNIPPE
ncbi:MAG: hypothetical protein LBP76_13945 [Treponema sp.]|jgi:hypothetical protein|nr:hypothetical protein [Treponema sp.]